MVTEKISTELMLTESGVVQNPLGMVAGLYLFCLTISWSTYSSSLFLISSLKWVLFPLFFFLFPSSFFPVSLFRLSFDSQAVPRFSKLWISYRGCSEFLELCGLPLHHIFSEVYQFCSILTHLTCLPVT